MTPFDFLKLVGATWYLSYAVVNTHGAFGMFEWLRTKLPLGGLTTCIICLSIWIAFALMMLSGYNNLIDAFAVAGVALLLHGFTGWRINMEQHNG